MKHKLGHNRNRKSGQNLAYKNENRHAKSHCRRIRKHIMRYASGLGEPFARPCLDKIAGNALINYATQCGQLADAKRFLGIK